MINMQNEYKKLLTDVLSNGNEKPDRTGTGTRALFGKTIKHDMALGFPALTSKKVFFNLARTELLWILNGRTDLKYLEDNGVKYWRPDYNRSGRIDETLGPVYGKQWRDFNGVDQLKNLVADITNDPSSRRLMVSSWAPHEMNAMVLPPCHYAFQIFISEGTLSLLWNQRSADIFLGLPYDIMMYGLLLELLAKGANLKPGQLIGQLGDCHLYNNHIEQTQEFLTRKNRKLPTLQLDNGINMTNFNLLYIPNITEIKLNNYNPYPAIKAELSVGK